MKNFFVKTAMASAMTMAVMSFPACGDDNDDPQPQKADYSGLVLNELNGAGTAPGGKFIELYNKGDKAIPLAGVMIFKDLTSVKAYVRGDKVENYIPVWICRKADTSIPSKGFLALASDTDNSTTGFLAGFSAKKSVQIVLADPDGIVLDVFTRGAVPAAGSLWGVETLTDVEKDPYTANTSFARCPDGTGAFKMAAASKGSANPASSSIAIP